MRLSEDNNRAFTMRQILFLAVAALVAGGYLAHFADKAVVEVPSQAAAVQSSDQPQQSSAGQHRVALESGRDGHFRVDARVNGRHTDFVVDTGATLVILRETDAAMIGIRPMRSEYTAVVSTANGKINAARAKLERIEIGDISAYDVPALVLPDEALSQNLLGVAFLSKLRRYEVADGRLVLEQ
jgi:aspartyl protease family protein